MSQLSQEEELHVSNAHSHAHTHNHAHDHSHPSPLYPPPLHTPHDKRKNLFFFGVIIALLDLCLLPMTYYYAMVFDTHLPLQDSTLHPPHAG